MKTTWKQSYNEIKEAYKATVSAPKVHGEEVISFEVRCQTPWVDRYFSFDAPRCSSNDELTSYATTQRRALNQIINMTEVEAVTLSFKVKN